MKTSVLAPLAFFYVIGAASLHASMVTNTTCTYNPPNPPGGSSISVSNPSSCTSQPLPGFGTQSAAVASVSYDLTIPTSASNPAYLTFNFEANAYYSEPARFGSTYAQAAGTADLTFYTLGPVRAGEIKYFSQLDSVGLGSANAFDSSAKVNISVGNLSTSCVGTPLTDICTGDFRSNAGMTNDILPFTLGQQFIFHEDVFASGGSAGGPAGFGFEILDANGNPVQLFLAPEPDSVTLLGCGAAVVFGLRRRRRA